MGFTLRDPDKMIDYSKTPSAGRYAVSFLAFSRDNWVENLHGYLDFADAHFAAHGFRCNLPLGSYFVRHDQNSLFPLLNQSPGVTREQTAAAYGPRWKTFSDWVRSVDPQGRLRNPFFDELLVS